jgi:tripartite ATP-independent transporter DctM subunit
MTDWLPIVYLAGGLVLGLVTGLPMAFALASSSIIVSWIFVGPMSLPFVATNIFGMMSSMVLVAMPLFIFMACVLEKCGVAHALYDFMQQLLGGLRGGLSMGTVLICTLIAAMSGVTTTGVVTMGIIALPIMLKHGYSKSIAIGPILAGGALGILIPPSVSLIIYGMIARVSIGRLFAAGIIPGLMLSILFLSYIGIRCYFQPHLAPALPREERVSVKEKILLAKGLVLPALLIFAVLGSIFLGIASPTEAAAVGAVGALVSAAVNRRLNWQMVKEAGYRAMAINGMIMWILFGTSCFTSIFFRTGGTQLVQDAIIGAGLDPIHFFLIAVVIMISFGFFVDEITEMMIIIPILLPIVIELGYDPVWFGILFMVEEQMDYLTPPFGFTLFYMKGVAPPEVSMGDIYRSILPFIAIQFIVMLVILFFPQITLWLPDVLFGLR